MFKKVKSLTALLLVAAGMAARGSVTIGTFTVDTATDELIAAVLVNGHRVMLTTTGTLPAGLNNATEYYVVQASATRFKVSLTAGGAAVDITDAGTGTHTVYLTDTNTLGRQANLTKRSFPGNYWENRGAMKGNLTKGTIAQAPPIFPRKIVAGTLEYVLGGRSDSEGDALAPSLRLDAKGVWRFRWIVASGTRTISVKCKQAVNLTPRPSLVVKANPAIGVNADATGTAASSTGWVTIGPVTITPTSAGAVWVELRANYDGQSGIPCYFDDVVVE